MAAQTAADSDAWVIKLLLRRGAYIDAKSQVGETALMYAAFAEHSDVVQDLCKPRLTARESAQPPRVTLGTECSGLYMGKVIHLSLGYELRVRTIDPAKLSSLRMPRCAG
jgi:hypothetical protein